LVIVGQNWRYSPLMTHNDHMAAQYVTNILFVLSVLSLLGRRAPI